MRYLSVSVGLIILLSALGFGCQGERDNTGIPVYNLEPNRQQGDTGGEPQGPILVRITLDPGASNIELGGHQIYNAYGRFSDNSVLNITGTVKWYSTNELVGTVDEKGVFNASGVGWTAIGASYSWFGENPQIVYADYAFANVFASGEKPLEPVQDVKANKVAKIIVVSWDFSTDPSVKGYNVYRSRISGEGYDKANPLNDELITLNYYEDINPGSGVLYYVVAAVNMDDEVGAFSQEVEFDFHPEPPEEGWEP